MSTISNRLFLFFDQFFNLNLIFFGILMLWLIFRSVLCINYKIVHSWVYYYEETIDRAFIEQRFGHDNLECEMTLENPFEKKLLESSVKSSFTEIKKEKNTIFFRFTFDTYKNFEFLKNGHKKSLFFTEFNFNPSTTINRKLMLQKIAKTKREKGEVVEDKIEEKIDCEPKLLSGFLFVNEVKNLKRESKMADYFYYGRFAPLRGFRLMESIFLQRIVNFIDHLKAFPDYRIQPVVESMEEEIFASRRKKNPFKKLQLALVDLLSVMSKNRKLKNLGITFDNPDVYIKRNPVLEEFANENFPLVKKLEEFYDIYFADSVEATHDHYPRLDLRGVRCLTKDTTCYFQMFDMLSVEGINMHKGFIK